MEVQGKAKPLRNVAESKLAAAKAKKIEEPSPAPTLTTEASK